MFQIGVIGLMSGTSLDGLDICFVRFTRQKNWQYDQIITETIPYSMEWRNKLNHAIQLSPHELESLDRDFGQFLAEKTNAFIEKHQLGNKVDLIASHGHTVHHRPEAGVTVQIGNGKVLADLTGKKVVFDFRTKDVALGGQGAPLVPVGDAYLFGQYDACLNLGGISNISYHKAGNRIAFDIAPCNLPLNKLMREHFEQTYDFNGEKAKKGQVIPTLHAALNQLDYYQKSPPKSLAVEWLNSQFYPLINEFSDAKTEDLLATIVAHETDQIATVFKKEQVQEVLITGGGAYNTYFIDQLKGKTATKIIIPPDELVGFKEALIFGLLGVLKLLEEINTFCSVTGARQDSIGGKLIQPSRESQTNMIPIKD